MSLNKKKFNKIKKIEVLRLNENVGSQKAIAIGLNYLNKKKSDFTDNDIAKFIEENKENLKVEYLDFEYSILNPKN